MPRNVGKLTDEEIARQFVALIGDELVAKTLRALALQHELERRHGQQHARSFVVAEQTKRNRRKEPHSYHSRIKDGACTDCGEPKSAHA